MSSDLIWFDLIWFECDKVTEETSTILRRWGYHFEQRGLVSVKGKGQLMTYYLIEKDEHKLPQD